MKKLFPLLAVLAALLVCAAPAFAQQTHTVELVVTPIEGQPIPQFYFEPTGLLIQPGDTINFVARSAHHTVTSYSSDYTKPQRVPDGVEAFSSPVIPTEGSWSHTFAEAGTYDLWCAPHEQYGMAMRVVVGEPGGPAEQAIGDMGPEGVFGAAGTVLSDPALASANIVTNGSVLWAEISDTAKAAPAGPPGEGDH